MPSVTDTVYRFANFTFVPHRDSLECDKVPVNIGTKPAQLLTLLLATHNSWVPRDKLQNLWADSESPGNNLDTTLHKLRQLLGQKETTKDSGLIRTKRGYGFGIFGEVEITSESEIKAQNPDGLFAWVDKRLSRVSYLHISPVDIKSDKDVIQSDVLPEPIYIAPPPRDVIEEVLSEVVALAYPHAIGTESEQRKRNDLIEVLKNNQLWESREDKLPKEEGENLRVFKQLRARPEFAAARRKAIRDLLLTNSVSLEMGNGFEGNGSLLALSKFKVGRTRDEVPVVRLVVRSTDYFTYRVLAECSSVMLGPCGLGEQLSPNGLADYLSTDFQDFVNLGLGVAVVVHTAIDNRIIIRRRSKTAANFEDGGKLVMSMNEGLKASTDIDDQYRDRLRQFEFMINRGLEEELFGPHPDPALRLIPKITSYKLTGAFIYTPNMSVNLCFVVSADCTAEEALEAARCAKDSNFEFQLATDCPKFNFRSIDQFIRGSIPGASAGETWDEGALVAVMLSALAVR
ncbi:MAG: hypothetical protein FJW31_30415 [Acidobacteria bacterium]|nr:hypothetical protein [Acidobacteriota bacterium]